MKLKNLIILNLMRRVVFIRFAYCGYLWPRQESNLNLGLRRPLYYPLYYEAIYVKFQNG